MNKDMLQLLINLIVLGISLVFLSAPFALVTMIASYLLSEMVLTMIYGEELN